MKKLNKDIISLQQENISLKSQIDILNKRFNALNIDKDREVFLALQDGQFSGSLILKNDKSEKKICTLFVRDKDRYNGLGLDFIRIASEELETYKLPITVSEDAIDIFSNSRSFNFYQKEVKPNLYKKGLKEYIGYIMYHDKDKELRGIR